MNEGSPITPEESQESIPTSEEITSLFEQLIGEGGYETVRQRDDEKGLYLWEVTTSGEGGVRNTHI